MLSLASLGVRLGRNGREAWADYQKPLGGLHGGFWSKSDNVRILYGRFSKYKQNQGSGECDHFLASLIMLLHVARMLQEGSCHLQFFAAVGAVAVVLTHLVTTAGTASVLRFLLRLVNNGGSDNASGYGNDGVAEQHDEC